MSYADLARIVTVRPLDRWSGPRTVNPPSSPFRAAWSDTVQLLGDELRHLEVHRAVLELDGLRETDLRNDGLPRATAKPDRAVALAFETHHGPLRYEVDTYERPQWGPARGQPSWQHNVRAIAKALEALRAVDRYGVTKRGEQYAGWKALPAPIAMDGPSHMTHTEARELLEGLADLPWGADPSMRKQVIRRARAAAHPDRHANDTELWDQVVAAVAVVDR